jgi:vanillate O-demethylase ferredoxin subunit
MQLRVCSITYLAEAINGYELVDPRGRDLPRFAAGAHVDLRFGNLVRQYSLYNDPAERRRYCIAVLREEDGRGGSRRLHDDLRAGDLLEVSMPRNNFPLAGDAERHLLIAGGIGITPIMSMIPELQRRGADFRLYYCARSAGRTAFREDLAGLAARGYVEFHYDGGDPRQGLDIRAMLRDPPPGTHLYYCGPASLMAAAAEAAKAWPAGTVHCEYFTAAPAVSLVEDKPFRIRLAKRGVEYEIPIGETIVGVLRRHGIVVPTSCELGYCGACVTRYLEGEPDHRDQVLREYGRGRFVLICCARSKSPILHLDL